MTNQLASILSVVHLVSIELGTRGLFPFAWGKYPSKRTSYRNDNALSCTSDILLDFDILKNSVFFQNKFLNF